MEKTSSDIRKRVRNFCDRYGIKQEYFVEKALEEKFEEKIFQDIKNKINTSRDSPRPYGFEKLTDEEGYRVRHRREVYQ